MNRVSLAILMLLAMIAASIGCSDIVSSPDAGKCPEGQSVCGGVCVDTHASVEHCGTCEKACAVAQICSSGVCAASCGAGLSACGGACVNRAVDPANCGACGAVCPSGLLCSAGVCALSCSGGTTECGALCVQTANDPANCGACGNACAAGQTVCGNACVNLASGSANCGSCGVACLTFAPHASASGAASQCALTCSTGYLDCDGNGLTGCEAPLGPSNCGGCGVVCGATAFCAKPFACATCGATDLGNTVPQTVTGTTIGKADQFDSFCGFGNAPDVRYQFTAPAAATYTFDTLGSAFNTVIEVRDGGCAGPRLGCNDDSGGAFTSKVSLPLTQGQIVTIFIDGRQGSQGSYTLHVK